MLGFRPEPQYFLKFLLAAAGILSASYSIFLACSIIGKDFTMAVALAVTVLGLYMPVMGYVLVDIPVWWKWLEYVSFLRNGFEAVAVNEMAGNSFFCTSSQYVPTGCNPSDTATCICPVTDGSTALVALGFNSDAYWRNIGALFGWFGFYLIIAFLGLRFLQKERR
jgi:ABC-type multidrug transport system permease subunit